MAFPVLNVFANTAFPITYDRVQQVIDDPEVITPGIGTGVALGSREVAGREVNRLITLMRSDDGED